MEHPQLYRLLLVLALSSLPSSLSLPSADPHPYSYCAPTTSVCGAGTSNLTVSYPFLIDGRPGNCGYEGFGIKCVNGAPFITISKKPYLVKNLDYTNHLITVVDPSYVNIACPKGFDNTTIDPSSLFHYSDAIKNVPIFFQCPSTQFVSTPPFYDIGCQIDGGSAYYRIDNTSILDMPGFCTSLALVPMDSVVANTLENGMGNLTAALQEGFSLKWMPGNGWCDNCISTGGFCGYKTSSPAAQTCYCGNESVLGSCPNKGTKIPPLVIYIVPPILAGLLSISFICYWRWRKRWRGLKQSEKQEELHERSLLKWDAPNASKLGQNDKYGGDFTLFEFSQIAAATDNFSVANKLGEGGFGPVYKGQLRNGQEIGVKRLSALSGQGLKEFENEILLIAKLQHRNLVRLLGCCIKAEEKLLVYEYMPNKSLDLFLFDPTRGAQLDWDKRFHIIEGIAEGLLYLHKYSRLRIIHRDMKASNILLDEEMNPKISDFGLARIFGSNETEANTNRVVGTYGYMSPEYAAEGIFSFKSDVFSFGVLLLEIVTGKRNAGSHRCGNSLYLLGYAWELWKENKYLDLKDPCLSDTCPANKLRRCMQVALLSVQECATDRPNMVEVIQMLTSENADLPEPKQPAFFAVLGQEAEASRQPTSGCCSLNNVTMSTVDAR